VDADASEPLDWLDKVVNEYLEDSPVDTAHLANGSDEPAAECLYENPLPGKRIAYEPPARELTRSINPRFTPDRLSSFRDFQAAEESSNTEAALNDEDLEDDQEVNKVMASQPSADPQLQLLGRPQIRGISGTVSQRSLATAALLALSPTGLDRSQIREHIWDGRDIDMRQVRKVLTDLQNSVGSCLGRMLNNNSLITITIDTDLDEIERRVKRASTMAWPQASVLLAETLELVVGEPLKEVTFHHWWNWVDNDGGLIRRQLLERVETALTAAGNRAQEQRDWALLRSIGEAGRLVSALSQRMVGFASMGALMSGRTDLAMAIVVQWEDVYESTFDEPAPHDLRKRIVEASRDQLTQ